MKCFTSTEERKDRSVVGRLSPCSVLGKIYGTPLEIMVSQHVDAKQLSPPPKWSQQ